MYVVDTNVYVVINTQPVSYNYRCEGKLGNQGTLSKGTWLVEIAGNCIIETDQWKLESVTSTSENYTTAWEVLPYRFHTQMVNISFKTPKWDNLSEISVIEKLNVQDFHLGPRITFQNHTYILYSTV